jgi:mannosyl-glycoprotein endo-beta-N-acetylglucosaminidase/stage II sporulation protein P
MNTREVFDDQEVYIVDGFRWYDNAKNSFYDRVDFLKENSRYEAHGVFKAKSPEEQADALQRAGYATSPNYASTLKWIINTYDLKKLDKLLVKKN